MRAAAAACVAIAAEQAGLKPVVPKQNAQPATVQKNANRVAAQESASIAKSNQ